MSLGHSLRLAFRRATSLREGGKASILLLYKLQFELQNIITYPIIFSSFWQGGN